MASCRNDRVKPKPDEAYGQDGEPFVNATLVRVRVVDGTAEAYTEDKHHDSGMTRRFLCRRRLWVLDVLPNVCLLLLVCLLELFSADDDRKAPTKPNARSRRERRLASVGLDAIASPHRRQRGCNHFALDAHLVQVSW